MAVGDTYLSTIKLNRQDMKFSSGHFTIFSATERERLHGHNYHVSCTVKAEASSEGITYDYSETRKVLIALCRELNEYMLLPKDSPHLKVTEDETYYYAQYGEDKMIFLKKETLILPLSNITSEELARWFVERLIEDKPSIKEKKISEIMVGVSTTPGQEAYYQWKGQ
jgi:6-pyruvoyltetrahydropterin/6-carboxytetrahydropterin synthase